MLSTSRCAASGRPPSSRPTRSSCWRTVPTRHGTHWPQDSFRKNSAMRVTTGAISTVSSVWGRAFLASAMGKLWTYVILMIALRFAEIPPDVISATQAFVVWTLVLLVQSIPLTPGGVGFVEAAYIAMFGAIAGQDYATQIGVAVALYRAAQWALPIPVGWMVVGWWRIEIKRGKLPDPFRGQAVKTQLS